MQKRPYIFFLCLIGFNAIELQATNIRQASNSITIDGMNTETDWDKATWKSLEHSMAGTVPDKNDFSGRYKLLWDRDHLYILAEITDDILFDKTADPRALYWDDDCLEVFIDEDHSGGDHLHNFNAFAYHIALDNQAVDMGRKSTSGQSSILLLNDHVNSNWKRRTDSPNTIVWEVAVKIFNPELKPVKLKAGKAMGFMLAYCDNDGSETREHFMGSQAITPVNGDKNRGYIDASVFGKVKLID